MRLLGIVCIQLNSLGTRPSHAEEEGSNVGLGTRPSHVVEKGSTVGFGTRPSHAEEEGSSVGLGTRPSRSMCKGLVLRLTVELFKASLNRVKDKLKEFVIQKYMSAR